MRFRLDIPDRQLSKLRKKAHQKGCTVNDLIVRSVERVIAGEMPPQRRVRLPIIESDRPGSLDLDNDKIYKIIDFP